MSAGRFAPSPTGPLHLGSLVAAAGSWLFARQAGGKWLVRMEDLDTPRVVAGSADEILHALERYGLTWDGDVVYQSQRTAFYDEALVTLRANNVVFDCGCSRADLPRAASAPLGREPVYPGTCREGLPPGRVPRAIRFRAPHGLITFDDVVAGHVEEDVAVDTGDFVVRRADGVYAYQLAVVVDDAAQSVTQVVRGADLLPSTARQIAMQRALGLPTPRYAHLPLIVNAAGTKLGKRDGALPLPSLDEKRVAETLAFALRALGVADVAHDTPQRMLAEGLTRFDPAMISREALWSAVAQPPL
jgi:glutamyl-Q tRNA(Asp) synthetase